MIFAPSSVRSKFSSRIFSENGRLDAPSIFEISKKSLKTILDEIFGSLDNSHNCEYKIVGKEEENLGVVDYINFIFFHILSVVDSKPRMKQNFKIVAPKIAIVKLMHNKVYLSRKKKQNHKVTLDNLIREFSG